MQYTFQNRLVTDTATDELRNVSVLLDKYEIIRIDLSNIACIDSAGIALLIELKNMAKNKNKGLFYDNPTTDILRLCQLYHINL